MEYCFFFYSHRWYIIFIVLWFFLERKNKKKMPLTDHIVGNIYIFCGLIYKLGSMKFNWFSIWSYGWLFICIKCNVNVKIKCIIISTIQNLYNHDCYSDHIICMKVVSIIFLIIIINMSQFKFNFFFAHNGFVAVVGNDRIRVLICMQCYWRFFCDLIL